MESEDIGQFSVRVCYISDDDVSLNLKWKAFSVDLASLMWAFVAPLCLIEL